MRAEFGSYELNEPPFEDWCPMAKAYHRLEEDRKLLEAEKIRSLRRREFPDEPEQ